METNRITAIILSLAVLALAGCGTEQAPDRPPSEAREVDTTNPYGLDDDTIDTLHLANIRSLSPELEAVPDEDLLALAHAICAAFDTGASFEDVAIIAYGSGFSANTGGTIIGSSVAAYCDEYLPLIG